MLEGAFFGALLVLSIPYAAIGLPLLVCYMLFFASQRGPVLANRDFGLFTLIAVKLGWLTYVYLAHRRIDRRHDHRAWRRRIPVPRLRFALRHPGCCSSLPDAHRDMAQDALPAKQDRNGFRRIRWRRLCGFVLRHAPWKRSHVGMLWSVCDDGSVSGFFNCS